MLLESIGSLVSTKDGEKLLYDINVLMKNENKTKFPGYQPVSFMKCHLKNLLDEDYLVCEKSDGIRALLYVCIINNKPFGFFLDRKNLFYRPNLIFPHIGHTLFDGEVVVDREEGGEVVRYLICDTILFNNKNITELCLIDRLSHALKFVVMYGSIKEKTSMDIHVKEMQKSYGFYNIYTEGDKLKHDSDGLIFTPLTMPYKSGTASRLLKWKPPHLNSVDFIARKSKEWEYLYELFCFGNLKDLVFFDYYFHIKIGSNGESTEDSEDTQEIDIDGKLGEFKFNSEKWVYDLADLSLTKGGWELIKLRTDKDLPNAISVVINVMNSIKEDIDMESFSKYVPEIRQKWKLREMANTK